jgi:plastocyanin
MKKGVFALLFLFIASVLVMAMTACGPALTNSNPTTSYTSTSSPTVTTSPDELKLTGSVQIKDFTFTPKTIEIKKGGTITWINKDSAEHTVKFISFNSGNMSQGGTFSHTFDKIGSFTYICGNHTYMSGTIIVR